MTTRERQSAVAIAASPAGAPRLHERCAADPTTNESRSRGSAEANGNAWSDSRRVRVTSTGSSAKGASLNGVDRLPGHPRDP